MLQEVRPVVTLEVVHPDEVGAGREGDGLRAGHAHQQRADETRPGGHRHRVDLAEPDARDGQRLLEQRVQRLDVRARRDLGHDPAEPLVQVHLRGDQVGTQLEPVFHHRDGGLVARRLDAERDHAGRTGSGIDEAIAASRLAKGPVRMSSVHMISASSCSSW